MNLTTKKGCNYHPLLRYSTLYLTSITNIISLRDRYPHKCGRCRTTLSPRKRATIAVDSTLILCQFDSVFCSKRGDRDLQSISNHRIWGQSGGHHLRARKLLTSLIYMFLLLGCFDVARWLYRMSYRAVRRADFSMAYKELVGVPYFLLILWKFQCLW